MFGDDTMADDRKRPKLPPLSSLDFEQLKQNYIEFLSLAGKSEEEVRAGITNLSRKVQAQKEERDKKKHPS